ncbi:apoptosis regulatory protein Siva-like [Musca domestica]|uniref:Apoptosis regulatory protein Siva n=1 Tax=Musca domestica TaxID=7370 RepID=A0A1I8M2F7_MUSDO|nr:apoptosis regulatory protein Siva [Musca domestica]XP_058978946.1 apoptosis regulatory protein Siva-like [Musca domestica]
MQRVSLKRMRSEESSPYILQTKMHVNEKIVDSHDSNKMKQIYAKTTKMLFQAARSVSNNNIQPDRNKKTPLHRLVVISGNGQIEPAKQADEQDDEFLWVRRKAKCCNRDTYVQDKCVNCQNDLCEECGYSCVECGKFVCSPCISLFGSGNVEQPLCEKCSLFA